MPNKVQTLEGSDGSDDKKITNTSISGDGAQVYNNCTFNYPCPEYQCKNAPEQKERSVFGSAISALVILGQLLIKMT